MIKEEQDMAELQYRRILLKLGGEALAGEGGFGINPAQADFLARKVVDIINMGVQVAIVIGGGNIWRGMQDGMEHGMERVTADHMGMLATVMNSLALQDALERNGVPTRVMTGIEVRAVAEPYIQRRAVRHLEKGRAVIFGAGTGNPYFTTDTAAALRAMEIDAEALIKATKVDAVYDSDPKQNANARRFERLTYIDALNMRVGVMDSTAMAMCMDNDLPIYVVNLWQDGALEKVVRGEPVGTLIAA
ncbi:MAG: UMP kinase [Chloroflexi bacterium]|nr:MAG: UMP kinase [Chloroflexota bacterium]